MKFVCVLLIVVLMFSHPLFGFDFSGERSVTGRIQSYQSGLQAVQLMGKSPEYVLNYAVAYQVIKQSNQNAPLKVQIIATTVLCCLGSAACLWMINDAYNDAHAF